ncbi:hypothetical protein MITS9508_00387 [Synechococcus sp. MIT S9508]|nr:hypothetical protein MITS9508_00387 [Synechococcus sp. MIT S9508]
MSLRQSGAPSELEHISGHQGRIEQPMGRCLASSDGEKNPAPTVQAPQFNHDSVGHVDLRLHRSLGSLGIGKRLSQHLSQKKAFF